jgi:hypothetical protein
MKKIAYVADNEIFRIDEAYQMPDRDRYEECILSDAFIVESTQYPNLKVDSFYENGFFYDPTDIEKTNPISPEEPLYPEAVYFAHVSNGVVFRIHVYSIKIPPHRLFIAGYSSNPKFYDVTDIKGVYLGWVWNGSTFIQPTDNR